MPAPREVKIDVTVRATRLNDQRVRVPLVPKISVTPRQGGLTVEIDWGRTIDASGQASVQAAAALPTVEDVPSVQQAQDWLAARIRAWNGGRGTD